MTDSQSARPNPTNPTGGRPGAGQRLVPPPAPDLDEKGRASDGSVLSSDRRLFMQLHVFSDCSGGAGAWSGSGAGVTGAVDAIKQAKLPAVVYEDVRDPRGLAVLTYDAEPDFFVDRVRPVLGTEPFASMTAKPDYTMFGRTYTLGYEPDLQEALFDRPIRHATNADWPWAIWYPLRRAGAFEQLPADEQRKILMEHGTIGRSFGEADLAHDVRLACHGLDAHDCDFVIGLMGKALQPLSGIVQRMRKTQQTSLYLERLGPFFVGRVVHIER